MRWGAGHYFPGPGGHPGAQVCYLSNKVTCSDILKWMGERRDEIWAMMSWTLCDFRSPMHLDRPDNSIAEIGKKSGKINDIPYILRGGHVYNSKMFYIYHWQQFEANERPSARPILATIFISQRPKGDQNAVWNKFSAKLPRTSWLAVELVTPRYSHHAGFSLSVTR